MSDRSEPDPTYYGYAGSGRPFDQIPELNGNPLDQLLIDDHNGGYWTTRDDWDRFVAESSGEITFRVLRVVHADAEPPRG